MSNQLNIFDQHNYQEYYKRFYAKQLREAKESREKTVEPDYMISINPSSMGKKMYFKDLLI